MLPTPSTDTDTQILVWFAICTIMRIFLTKKTLATAGTLELEARGLEFLIDFPGSDLVVADSILC